MHSSPLATLAQPPVPELHRGLQDPLAGWVRVAQRACRQLPRETPERTLWLSHQQPLLASLRRTMVDADGELREAISAQLDDIVEASGNDVELLRRLILLASHARDYVGLCDDPWVPPELRRRGRALQFRLFDRLARVPRDPDIEQIARRRNQIFVELGLRPRSLALLDWCAVAVRIAVGGPLRESLATLSATEAEQLLAAKIRFDLLAIELNIALDDLADHGRDAGLFALTVTQVFGSVFAGACFRPTSAVGRYFLEAQDRAKNLRGTRAEGYTRYLGFVDELYREVVAAGRALVGERWDDAVWSAQMRRIIGAMMLSLVENERPHLLANADWQLDFHGPDRLGVQAANSNRVVFELVGLWCHEQVSERRLSEAAKQRLLGAFEDLQIAQQLGNCLATLERELDEGDRSNCIVEGVVELWRELSANERVALVDEAGLARPLGALFLAPDSDDLVSALYEILQRPASPTKRGIAVHCLQGLVSASGAVPDAFEQWSLRVDAAAAALESVGFCGQSSRQAQVDLLLLHLVLLKPSPLADSGERL